MSSISEPKVSIVSLYYNRSSYVEASVQSLLDQTYANLEIVLVDDCSSDGTYEKMLSVTQGDSRVVLKRNQENMGFTTTLARTIDGLDSDYIAIHGSGDISIADRVEKQAAFLKEHEDVVMIGSSVTLELGSNKVRHLIRDDQKEHSRHIVMINPFVHGEVMFRLDVYRSVGGYRSQFVFAQDRDLWLRMAKVGKLRSLKDILYVKKKLNEGVSDEPKKLLKQRILSNYARSLYFKENSLEDYVSNDTFTTDFASLELSRYSVLEIIKTMHGRRMKVREELMDLLGRYKQYFLVRNYHRFLESGGVRNELLAIVPVHILFSVTKYALRLLRWSNSSSLSWFLEKIYKP